MAMNQYDKPPSANTVDWDDPQLQRLLSKTEGWSLDNRGVFSPVSCEVHVGWGAGAGRPATLVYEQPGVMVVATTSIIPKGEQVRVDRVQAGTLRSTWGVVVDGREGRREEDRAHGLHVYWVHMR
jgi:hypothetical protein